MRRLYLPAMRLSVKRIGQLAVPAAAVALLFQLYWLRQTYISEKKSFRNTARECLQQAYQASLMSYMGQAIKPSGDNSNKMDIQSSINFEDLDDDNETVEESARRDSILLKFAAKAHLDTGKRLSVPVANVEYEQLSGFLSRMFSSLGMSLINTDTLKYQYAYLLKEKNITIPFQLYQDSALLKVKNDPRLLTIHPALNNETNTIGAIFAGETGYLLQKISPAIIVSFFIVLLVIGCIWTLWRIVIRQKKLEQMKQDFISHVTHELKTPVAVLQATNEALLTFGGINNPDMTERYLRLNKTELDKLQGLIDHIMKVTRQEQQSTTLQTQVLSLPECLHEIMQRFTPLEHVSITLNNQSARQQIETDKQAFEIIFSNLLDNAIKYNNKNEKIITLTVKDNRENIIITVTDNGDGIEKQHLPFIFDKFYRITNGDMQDTKGYGLGLSHVHALVQHLRAKITVNSIPGAGTTFTLQFPAYEQH